MFNYNVQVYPFFYLYTVVLCTSYKFTACIIPGGIITLRMCLTERYLIHNFYDQFNPGDNAPYTYTNYAV
jgi:hypothetical protein